MSKPPLHPAAKTNPFHLWQQFCAGDSSALGALADQFYRPLLNYGLKLSTDREFLKDLIQELFLDLWTRRQAISPPDDIKAYLLGAFRNKIYKERIRSKRSPQLTDLPFDGEGCAADPSMEDSLIEGEVELYNQQRIQHLLTALPKRQQEVIYLHYYEGLDADQIAEIMNIGRQSVYNLLSRTLKDLRAAWVSLIVFVLALFSIDSLR